MPDPTPSPDEGAPKASPLAGMDLGGLFSIGVSTDAGGSLRPEGWEPPEPAEVAAAFPGFQVEALIGRGGMGAVYRARQVSLDRFVAIKLLPREAGQDEAFVQRFHREARLLARLQHPHIVSVHDFGVTREGLLYLVMEFIEGRSLAELLRTGGLTVPHTLNIVRQICEALAFAHEEGIIHRDIKPANILLDKRGRVKVADFGLAKLATDTAPLDAPSSMHTRTGAVLGTPDYAAPEQLHPGSPVDHRADLYSLGVMLYEMLTGRIPRGIFEPPSKKSGTDPRLDEVVHKAMREEPAQRYQQATEMREDVTRVGDAAPTVTRRVPAENADAISAPPSRKTWKRVLIALALVILCVGGVLVLLAAAWFMLRTDNRDGTTRASVTQQPPPAPAPATPAINTGQGSPPSPNPSPKAATAPPTPTAPVVATTPEQSFDDLRGAFAITFQQRLAAAAKDGKSAEEEESGLADEWSRTSASWFGARQQPSLLDTSEKKLTDAIVTRMKPAGMPGPRTRLALSLLARRSGAIASSSNSDSFPFPPESLRGAAWIDIQCTGNEVAALSADGRVMVWDRNGVREPEYTRGRVVAALFGSLGRLYALTADGDAYRLDDRTNGDVAFVAHAVSMSRNTYLAAVAPDGGVIINNGSGFVPFPDAKARMVALTASDQLFLLSPDGRVQSCEPGKFYNPKPLDVSGVVDIAAGGAHAVLLMHDGSVKVADATGIHTAPVSDAAAIATYGNVAAVRTNSGKVIIWNIGEDNAYTTQITDACGAIAMDPNGTVLAITRSRPLEEARRMLSLSTAELKQRAATHGSNRYLAFDYPMPRSIAVKIAQSHGAHLVSITTSEMNDYLATTLVPLLHGPVLTGGHILDDQDAWAWDGDHPWGFTHWTPGSPPQHTALVLESSGRWSTVDANIPAAFILEWGS